MAVTKLDGTAPLRSDPSVKAGSATASPAAGGKPCGGTDNIRAGGKTMRAAANTTPSGSVSRPAGVRSFNDGSV